MTSSLRVLVTGGAGYIGTTLVPGLLQAGFHVTVLDNLMYGQATLLDCCSNARFDFIRGDIRDFELTKRLLSRFDVVIPLASIVGAPACKRDPVSARDVNLDAHLNLVKNSSNDQWLLFPTTNSGYGIGDADELCTEESPLRPISAYARTKVEVEEAFLEKGNAITYRLATVFGMSPRMRMDLLVNDFVYRALKDRVLVLFEEHFRRNYIHVKDVANAFMFGLQSFDNMKGEPYNVGLSSANLTKRELAEKIKSHVPELYIHSASIGEDPDKRDYLVSNDKLESLGWRSEHTLDDGIRELVIGYGIIRPNIFANV
jgi:nucleoside-diphosphate-sugar epimerase